MFYAKNFLKMDKIDRLLDALENPERFTRAEIEALLRDPEVKKTFDVLDKTKSSLRPVVQPDVEAEWKKFENTHGGLEPIRRFRFKDLLTRNIAASIAVGVVSLSAVAAIVGIGISRHDRPESSSPTIDDKPETIVEKSQPATSNATEEEPKVIAPEIKIFDNEPLETILSDIAAYYDCKVIFNKDSAKTLRLYFRWDNALTLSEVVESLNNFEQISLTVEDNTIKVD